MDARLDLSAPGTPGPEVKWRIMRRIWFGVLLAPIVVSAALVAQQASVAGLWRVEVVTPLGQGGVNMTINQSGGKLTGHVTDEYGGDENKRGNAQKRTGKRRVGEKGENSGGA